MSDKMEMGKRYDEIRDQAGLSCRETAELPVNEATELEFQTRLYAGDLGAEWKGVEGEAIKIVHFGVWNREPGPDFIGVEVVIDGKSFKGDIELDREDADWERHGHARNPAFANVVLHLFFKRATRRFFTRTTENRNVTQAQLPAPLPREISSSSEEGPRLQADEALTLIEAAARYRLLHKHDRWVRAQALHGRGGALFQAVATAMGYKNNKIPFLLAAQRTGLSRARREEGEALLFGLAGFLQAERFEKCDEAGRRYLRELWDVWWKIRDAEVRLILPEKSWKFAPLRPANHPHRRMGALAELCRHFPAFDAAIKAESPEKVAEFFSTLNHSYWSKHWNVFGQALSRKVALVGAERINDIVLNVFLPVLNPEKAWAELTKLKKTALSGKEQRALDWLVDRDTASRLPASALRQQGLLQLHDDFLPMSPRAVFESLKRSI